MNLDSLTNDVKTKNTTIDDCPQFLDINPAGKINFGSQWSFKDHRSGWPMVLDKLAALHNPCGVLFDGFIDQTFGWYRQNASNKGEIPYTTPWVGVMHNPPGMPEYFDYMASPQMILESPFMKESLSYCCGLFVFSEYMKSWLKHNVDCPVEALVHPTETPDMLFNWDHYVSNQEKKVIQLGYWLRKMHSIKHLDADGFKKVWPIVHDYAERKRKNEANAIDIYNEFGLEHIGDYEEWDRVSNSEYDYLLSENIAFLDLYDSSANNAVIECIVRNTPLLVNKLPAVVEYLGEDYPFYFETLYEAGQKIRDNDLIEDTYHYLTALDKSKLDPADFLEAFVESEIYKNLPVLENQKLLRNLTRQIDKLSDLNVVYGSPLANDYVFVVTFKDNGKKLMRCLKSIVQQCKYAHDAGVILIDDASQENELAMAQQYLTQQGINYVAIKNVKQKFPIRNLYNAVKYLMTRDDCVVIEADSHNYFEETDILGLLEIEYGVGARQVYGNYRMAPGSLAPGNRALNSSEEPNIRISATHRDPWNLDCCISELCLNTFHRSLFLEVPVIYFWERSGGSWLELGGKLSLRGIMSSVAGSSQHFINDVVYVYENHPKSEKQHPWAMAKYILKNFYRVPYGGFIGEYLKERRNIKQFPAESETKSFRNSLGYG